jgi:hypothetical protein
MQCGMFDPMECALHEEEWAHLPGIDHPEVFGVISADKVDGRVAVDEQREFGVTLLQANGTAFI